MTQGLLEHTVVGHIWLDLVIKHYLACREGDEERRAKLFDLIDNLTDEYTDAVEARIKSILTAKP